MCVSPITISQWDSVLKRKVSRQVPCGHCVECISRYQKDWQYRLCKESSCWKYVYFLTLTYRDDKLTYAPFVASPEQSDYLTRRFSYLLSNDKFLRARRHGCPWLQPVSAFDLVRPAVVRVDEVQGFIKRVRTSIARSANPFEFKYFLCSEYGPNTFRPHYHLLLFTNTDVAKISSHFVSRWQEEFGNVDWKGRPCTTSSDGTYSALSYYVSKYVAKPSVIESPYVVMGLVPRPFRLMSKGIASAHRESIQDRLDVNLINYTFDEMRIYRKVPRDLEFIHLPLRFAKYDRGKYGWQGNFHGFNLDFLDYCYKNVLTYAESYTDKNGDRRFSRYSLPRYFLSRIRYTQKFAERVTYNRRLQACKIHDVKVEDAQSPLHLALSAYIQFRNDELFNRQLDEFRRVYPYKSDSEIVSQVVRANETALSERARKKTALLIKFYNKSIF